MKFLLLILGSIGLAAAQPAICSTSATDTLVRAEGLTERIGDIIYSCTGTPGSAFTVDLSVQLNTAITNRISTGNIVTGTILTVDSGSGPQAVLVQPVLLPSTTLVWNVVPVAFSAQGKMTIRMAGVRANATAIPVGAQIVALLGGSISIEQSVLAVGTPELSLYAGFSGDIICEQFGAPLPANPDSFKSLILYGSAFASTRITEGWASAFASRSAPASLNADSGTRILVVYSGFPQVAQLFVPNVIAGSDAIQPTAGGDLGVAASGGAYAPSTSGSLLLALVPGADATGAGGTPGYTPGAVGSGTVTFDQMTELQLVNGTAYAVYEVVDRNYTTLESAQFPTFLGLARNVVTTAVETTESVTLAPVSTVATVSATSPIPRFVALTPPNDCGIIGDCGASYFPQLSVPVTSVQYTLPVGSPGQIQYIPVDNSGSGAMYWTASVTYASGSGWLVVQNPPAAAGRLSGESAGGHLSGHADDRCRRGWTEIRRGDAGRDAGAGSSGSADYGGRECGELRADSGGGRVADHDHGVGVRGSEFVGDVQWTGCYDRFQQRDADQFAGSRGAGGAEFGSAGGFGGRDQQCSVDDSGGAV